MTTLSAPETADTAQGWQTVEDLRQLLQGLGAEDDVLRRIVLRTDVGDRQYVSIPPLPADLVARLTQLQPAAGTS